MYAAILLTAIGLLYIIRPDSARWLRSKPVTEKTRVYIRILGCVLVVVAIASRVWSGK